MSYSGGSLASSRQRLIPENAAALPVGVELLGPVYWIGGLILAGASFRFGGIEALTIVFAILIALWALANPRSALSFAITFMVFLFVFFQREAPLGDELPEEFFFWGAGVALIACGIGCAALFSRNAGFPEIRQRLKGAPAIAMAVLLVVTLGAAANGLFMGNQPFAVFRQLFGCILLPGYYFAALAIFRSWRDIDRWLAGVGWVVALGAVWYVQKLSFASMARGVYYREQSPLTGYAGAIAVVAFAAIIEQPGIWRRLQGLAQLVACAVAVVLMGNRAALASLVVACGLLVIVCVSRRSVLAGALATVIVAGAITGAFYFGNRFLEQRGLSGDIARRFIIRVSEDRSFQGRMAQMDAVMSATRKNPVLGAGMGSETKFVAPEEGRLRLTSVDNGWGYVMLKMGLLGLAVFLAVVGLLLWRSLRSVLRFPRGPIRANAMALLGLLLYGLVVFWSGPAFLHFTSAGFFGTAFAAILVLAESQAVENAAASEGECSC